MDIGEPIREVEYEDPNATPAPVEPAIPATPAVEPAPAPAEEPVPAGV